MKHLLNDMTEKEKNAIREQHTGGIKVMTEKFSKLLNSKLGDSKPLVNEQDDNLHWSPYSPPKKVRVGDLLVMSDNPSPASEPIFGTVEKIWDQGNGQKRATVSIYGGSEISGELKLDSNGNGLEFAGYKIIDNGGFHDEDRDSQYTKPEQFRKTTPIKNQPINKKPIITTPEKNKYNGKTVNLFSNPQETMLFSQGKVLSEKVVENKVYFTFEFNGRRDKTLLYSCDGKLSFSDNPSKQFYNKKFTDSLKTNFCSANVGAPPKSDYAP
jgi:hypothetical protein